MVVQFLWCTPWFTLTNGVEMLSTLWTERIVVQDMEGDAIKAKNCTGSEGSVLQNPTRHQRRRLTILAAKVPAHLCLHLAVLIPAQLTPESLMCISRTTQLKNLTVTFSQLTSPLLSKPSWFQFSATIICFAVCLLRLQNKDCVNWDLVHLCCCWVLSTPVTIFLSPSNLWNSSCPLVTLIYYLPHLTITHFWLHFCDEVKVDPHHVSDCLTCYFIS